MGPTPPKTKEACACDKVTLGAFTVVVTDCSGSRTCQDGGVIGEEHRVETEIAREMFPKFMMQTQQLLALPIKGSLCKIREYF